MEPWIETVSGKHYYFQNPQPEQIDIFDIAVGLSNKCRFSGHTQFFSVAEHSVTVAKRLPKKLQLYGLLHDAAEAYLGDIPSPIKAILPDYQHLEDVNELAIVKKFKLPALEYKEVKKADLKALYTEAHYLLPSGGKDWSLFANGEWEVEEEYKPRCLGPKEAFEEFMEMYHELSGTS